ncbi:TPA: hypothetical protein DIS56_01730 [Candidatus Saccharibacteria bacterium]|nr:MAG: polymerase III, delta prime subunit protein [Candidatus Saccharibacteria bacterium GW2011_GWA2_46_10]HCM51830.1 hypothetical protein [Candidatus Saccharibacteria bacterium]
MTEFERLLMHMQTSQQIELFLKKPHHFLLLAGPTGSGKLTIGLLVGSKLLNFGSYQDIHKYPFFDHIVRPHDKKEISIDAVRDLTAKLRLRTTGRSPVRRIILIENAQHLSEEAQNALLKTLEEPPADSIFIFTVDSLSNLLPTIVSRARIIDVQPTNPEAAENFFNTKFDSRKIDNAWQLSRGRVGLMHALLDDGQQHELKQAIDHAKLFLAQAKYERLLDKSTLAQNREKLGLLLDALQIVIQALQKLTVQKRKKVNPTKFIKSLQLIQKLKMSLDANANSRLIYLTLCLDLEL